MVELEFVSVGIFYVEDEICSFGVKFFTQVSQKSLSRRQNSAFGRDSISYTLLDATEHPAFLNAFEKGGFKSVDKLLLAYKPRKKKFAAFVGEMRTEEVERFISSVVNGDIQFEETRQKPILK